MGNSPSRNSPIISNIPKKNKNSTIIYKKIETPINSLSQTSYLEYLHNIDFGFCKENGIGPYFLENIPSWFNEKYKHETTELLMKMMKKTNYISYTINSDPTKTPTNNKNKIDYEWFFKNRNLGTWADMKDLNNYIFNCPSTTFRIPLYLIKLSTNPDKYRYSNEHIDINDKKESDKIKHQIELDLTRTSFKYTVLLKPKFTENFRSWLYEIACRDQSLSYIQGMNFLAAFIWMFSGNQWHLALSLVFKVFYLKSEYFNMPFYYCYSNDFIWLKNYNLLFKDMLFKYENEIYHKIKIWEIDELIWVGKWIQTLFVLNFKFEIVMKFWDIIIAKGWDYILIISLSVITYWKEDMLKIKEIEDFLLVLDKINKMKPKEMVEVFQKVLNDIKENKYPVW